MKKILLMSRILATSVALCLLSCVSQYTQDSRVGMLKKNYDEKLKSANINIVGKITDMNGAELDDVYLSITYSRPKNIWATESESLLESMLANGDFSVQKKNYTTVRITFAKQGYRSAHFIFYVGKTVDAKDNAIQTAFHVKLRETGILAKLMKFDGRLTYNIKKDTQTICDLTKLSQRKLVSADFNLGVPIPLGKYIYLDFKRDENGEIVFGKKNDSGSNIPAPEAYILHFISSDPQDGFIVMDEKNPIEDLTYLSTAPANGYSSKAIIIPYEPELQLYFYIKCGKFFGKGKISNLWARKSELSHEYSLFMTMYFNEKPDDLNVNSN